jgi:hypothetical protein
MCHVTLINHLDHYFLESYLNEHMWHLLLCIQFAFTNVLQHYGISFYYSMVWTYSYVNNNIQ